jgi:hypothetical protein
VDLDSLKQDYEKISNSNYGAGFIFQGVFTYLFSKMYIFIIILWFISQIFIVNRNISNTAFDLKEPAKEIVTENKGTIYTKENSGASFNNEYAGLYTICEEKNILKDVINCVRSVKEPIFFISSYVWDSGGTKEDISKVKTSDDARKLFLSWASQDRNIYDGYTKTINGNLTVFKLEIDEKFEFVTAYTIINDRLYRNELSINKPTTMSSKDQKEALEKFLENSFSVSRVVK